MKTEGLTVTAPGGAERVLLHTCCAPCSSAIVERRGEIIKEYNFYNQQWCGCEFSRK